MRGCVVDKRTLGPQNYWRLHRAEFSNGIFRVDGFAALPGLKANDLTATVNGRPADVRIVPIQSPFAPLADYLDDSERTGFELRCDISAGMLWAEVQLQHGQREELPQSPLLASHIYLGDKSQLDVPEEESIRRVSGTLANRDTYINDGYSEYRRLAWMMHRHNAHSQPKPTLLDWGSGCGRVTRHFIADPDVGDVVGLDIDSDNVEWCRTHLAGDFHVVPLAPPTELPAASVDWVVSSSVLSHLRWDVARDWLAELHRICRRNARLILSYHGTASTILHRSHDDDLLQRNLGVGFDADERSTDLDGYVPDNEYYRNTFMNDAKARELFDEHFVVITIYESVLSGAQNAAVLAPR